MEKAFKTVEELVSILESRGVKTDDETAKAILRESYYAIVNGYKTPFLDVEAMKGNKGDVYKEGVEFQWIHDLFLFDRDLRFVTFKYLTRAEAVVKTAVIYAFCRNHQEESAYLDVSNFCAENEILVPKTFRGNPKSLRQQNITRLMETLNGKLVIKSKTRPFIKHYVSHYGAVPLWVLANDLTFGNVVHFYQLMQRRDQNEACRSIAKTSGMDSKRNGTLSPRALLRAGNILVDFRNFCAHDERLYCAKSGNDGFATMVTMLARVLPFAEVEDFAREISGLFEQYDGRLHHVTRETLLDDMGFSMPDEQ